MYLTTFQAFRYLIVVIMHCGVSIFVVFRFQQTTHLLFAGFLMLMFQFSSANVAHGVPGDLLAPLGEVTAVKAQNNLKMFDVHSSLLMASFANRFISHILLFNFE